MPRPWAVRFAVGSRDGPRSGIWRLWVSSTTSDVYVAQRGIATHMKVSLHESGLCRWALTEAHLSSPHRIAVPGPDPRGPKRWTRLPMNSQGLTRALAVLVPASEVISRTGRVPAGIIWIAPPAANQYVEFDVIYAAANADLPSNAARNRRAVLAGHALPNGERVFLVASLHDMAESMRTQIEQYRGLRVLQEGTRVPNIGMQTFAVENGVGVVMDVTVPEPEPERVEG